MFQLGFGGREQEQKAPESQNKPKGLIISGTVSPGPLDLLSRGHTHVRRNPSSSASMEVICDEVDGDGLNELEGLESYSD